MYYVMIALLYQLFYCILQNNNNNNNNLIIDYLLNIKIGTYFLDFKNLKSRFGVLQKMMIIVSLYWPNIDLLLFSQSTFYKFL